MSPLRKLQAYKQAMWGGSAMPPKWKDDDNEKYGNIDDRKG